MPSGIQVWDANGTLIVDTSTLVLKEIVLYTIDGSGSASGTSGNLALPSMGTTNVIPTTTVDYNQSTSGGPVNATYDPGSNSINYSVGSYKAQLRALAF